MSCKLARSCVSFVSRLERAARLKQYGNQKRGGGIVQCFDRKLEESRDHLVRTKGSYRQTKEMEATVIDIKKLSTSVRGLTLLSKIPPRTTFKAGQWVDMVIPDVETVGGFSVCSAPNEFEKHGILEFAIKYSDHPPAKWVHDQCHIGATVMVKFGGEFFYEPITHGSENLLLIAGGVGINPIYSIMLERWKSHQDCAVSTKLLYSASTQEDLIFKKNIEQICKEDSNFVSDFHVTHEKAPLQQDSTQISFRRIDPRTLKNAVASFETVPLCFICGPPNFIDDMADFLKDVGVQPDRIKFEKWW